MQSYLTKEQQTLTQLLKRSGIGEEQIIATCFLLRSPQSVDAMILFLADTKETDAEKIGEVAEKLAEKYP